MAVLLLLDVLVHEVDTAETLELLSEDLLLGLLRDEVHPGLEQEVVIQRGFHHAELVDGADPLVDGLELLLGLEVEGDDLATFRVGHVVLELKRVQVASDVVPLGLCEPVHLLLAVEGAELIVGLALDVLLPVDTLQGGMEEGEVVLEVGVHTVLDAESGSVDGLREADLLLLVVRSDVLERPVLGEGDAILRHVGRLVQVGDVGDPVVDAHGDRLEPVAGDGLDEFVPGDLDLLSEEDSSLVIERPEPGMPVRNPFGRGDGPDAEDAADRRVNLVPVGEPAMDDGLQDTPDVVQPEEAGPVVVEGGLKLELVHHRLLEWDELVVVLGGQREFQAVAVDPLPVFPHLGAEARLAFDLEGLVQVVDDLGLGLDVLGPDLLLHFDGHPRRYVKFEHLVLQLAHGAEGGEVHVRLLRRQEDEGRLDGDGVVRVGEEGGTPELGLLGVGDFQFIRVVVGVVGNHEIGLASQIFDGDADHELVLGSLGEEALPLSFGQGLEDLFEGNLLVGVVETLLCLFCVPDD